MDSRQRLIEAIENNEPIQTIKDLVFSMPKNIILEEDEKHFDILHYAIKANYVEIIHLFFLKGYFTEPHQPNCIPYLHLACKLGHATITNILLRERPNDFNRDVQHVCDKCAHLPGSMQCEIYIDFSYGDGSKEDKNDSESDKSSENAEDPEGNNEYLQLQSKSPLDIAAEGGHLKCVKLLLNTVDSKAAASHNHSSHSRNDKLAMSLLEKAVEKCSTKAVQLLLDSNEPTQEDINAAFKMALVRKLANCMDIILSTCHVEVKRVLNAMNPYHVLYMYSSAYQVHDERNDGIDDATEVLIKHNFDVNDYSIFGSFPLYSLINSMVEEKDFFPMEIPSYHIKALELLLKSGANPNFDEIHQSTNYDEKYPWGHTLGRPLHTSALNSLFGSLQSSDSWYAMFPEFVTHCCGLILRNGCDPCRVDGHGRTALHDLLKCLAIEHTMGNLNIKALPIIKILMRYGADPDIKSSTETFPVACYYQTLFNSMGGRVAFEQWKSSQCQSQALYLLTFMKHDTRKAARNQIVELCQLMEEQSSNAAAANITSHTTQMLQQYTHNIKSLQNICRLTIWISLKRQRDRLDQLPLPRALQNSILNLFT